MKRKPAKLLLEFCGLSGCANVMYMRAKNRPFKGDVLYCGQPHFHASRPKPTKVENIQRRNRRERGLSNVDCRVSAAAMNDWRFLGKMQSYGERQRREREYLSSLQYGRAN